MSFLLKLKPGQLMFIPKLSFSNKFDKLKQTSPFCYVMLCYATSFATQPITRLILLISIVIEGPVVMILVIGSNVLAFVSYKSFLKRTVLNGLGLFSSMVLKSPIARMAIWGFVFRISSVLFAKTFAACTLHESGLAREGQ